METILVTGVTGFIASHLVKYLVNHFPDFLIIGIDKMSYCSSINNISEIKDKSNFVFQKLDLTQIDQIHSLFKKHSIKHIFHLAAYTHVDHSFVEPLIFTLNNTLGTHNLIEVARHHDIKKFVHMSTDEVYGTSPGISSETSILDPTNPYSASKAGAELMVRSYYHSFKFPAVIIRCNNAYGTHQYAEKVIPLFVSKLRHGKKCTIHGNGEQTRSFIHTTDVCRALHLVWEKGELGEIYNIGTANETSILNLTKNIIKLVKPGENPEDWINYVKNRIFNDLHYRIDDSKITKLGFELVIDFEIGLKEVVDWYLANPEYLADLT